MIIFYCILVIVALGFLALTGFLFFGCGDEPTAHGQSIIMSMALVCGMIGVVTGLISKAFRMRFLADIDIANIDYFQGFAVVVSALALLVSFGVVSGIYGHYSNEPWWTPKGEPEFSALDRKGQVKRRWYMVKHYGPNRPLACLIGAVAASTASVAALFWVF